MGTLIQTHIYILYLSVNLMQSERLKAKQTNKTTVNVKFFVTRLQILSTFESRISNNWTLHLQSRNIKSSFGSVVDGFLNLEVMALASTSLTYTCFLKKIKNGNIETYLPLPSTLKGIRRLLLPRSVYIGFTVLFPFLFFFKEENTFHDSFTLYL